MLGNFEYCNPTKLYFGENSLQYLNTELSKYGNNIVLIYGGGSIKKNGIYDEVYEILKSAGKNVAEISGVMPNPTLEKLYEGVKIAKEHQADLLLLAATLLQQDGWNGRKNWKEWIAADMNYRKAHIKQRKISFRSFPDSSKKSRNDTGMKLQDKSFPLRISRPAPSPGK